MAIDQPQDGPQPSQSHSDQNDDQPCADRFDVNTRLHANRSKARQVGALARKYDVPPPDLLILVLQLAPNDFEPHPVDLRRTTPDGTSWMAERQANNRKALAMMRDGAIMLYGDHLDQARAINAINPEEVAQELASEDQDEARRYIEMAAELAEMRLKTDRRPSKATTTARLRGLVKITMRFWHEHKGTWPTRGFAGIWPDRTAKSIGAKFVCDTLRASGWRVSDDEVARLFQYAIRDAKADLRGTPGQE